MNCVNGGDKGDLESTVLLRHQKAKKSHLQATSEPLADNLCFSFQSKN